MSPLGLCVGHMEIINFPLVWDDITAFLPTEPQLENSRASALSRPPHPAEPKATGSYVTHSMAWLPLLSAPFLVSP